MALPDLRNVVEYVTVFCDTDRLCTIQIDSRIQMVEPDIEVLVVHDHQRWTDRRLFELQIHLGTLSAC